MLVCISMKSEVHGNDFTGVRPKSELEWFASELKKFWTVGLKWNSRSAINERC